MQKQRRGIILTKLVVIFFCVALSAYLCTFYAKADDECENYEDETTIEICQNTTWHASDNLNFNKTVSIYSGGTLTIEKGAHIKFSKDDDGKDTKLIVLGGRLVAAGEQDAPIDITSDSDRQSQLIEFHGRYYGDDPEPELSFLRYVEIHGVGYEIDDGGGQSSFWQSFIPSVYAKAVGGPAVKFFGGKAHFENCNFYDNAYADVAVQYDEDDFSAGAWSYLEIVNSNFEKNNNSSAVISELKCKDEISDCYKKVLLKNDWYGDSSGPSQPDKQIFTSGKIIAGDYFLESWSGTENGLSSGGASNVMFLPGIESSRLYDNSEKLWEPGNWGDVKELYLDSEGRSNRKDVHTKDGDVLDETPVGANIYQSFIGSMNKLKGDGEINGWKPVAYDWRLSLDDILKDGSIENTLTSLAASSKSGKVTIIAHSNGGLLAKALLKKIGNEKAQQLVDKIIFVAVPQLGTPETVAAMLHGKDQGVLPVFGSATARGLAENMPGAYNLLPSGKYFEAVTNPIVTFDNVDQSSDLKAKYPENIDAEKKLYNFLSDDFRRVDATDSDTDSPAKLNDTLLDHAQSLHDGSEGLDAWKAPNGIKIIQIAGWGADTLSQSIYGTHDKKICDEYVCQSGVDYLDPDFKFTIDGDGTVVNPSALWMKDGERYWVDLGTYNRNHPFSTLLGYLSIEHRNILEIPGLLSFVKDNITSSVKPISEYAYLSITTPPSSSDKRLQYSLHSPLTLDMYADVDGKTLHTGVNEDGIIEQQIPGTTFKEYGDKKYIFTDEDVPTRIVMKGYDEGKFTFSVEEFEGDDSQGKIEFKDLPVNPETQATFSLASNLESATDLKIDKDGDGDIDWKLQPKIGEITTLDSTPPATTADISGTEGKNGWYTSDAMLKLEAQDNAGGTDVQKTEYSMDDGTVWNEYAQPVAFSNEGVVKIKYRSTDNQGNVEEVREITIKIDKTAPEGKISFNGKMQKLEIIGSDNLSPNVTVETSEQDIGNGKKDNSKKLIWQFLGLLFNNKDKAIRETTTLSDEAGHKTRIILDKKKDGSGFIDLSVVSLSYDNQEIPIGKNNLQYKWLLNWWNSKYIIFAAHIRTASSILESHYFPVKNQTWIMENPNELADDNSDDNSGKRPVRKKMQGMVIPAIITNKGEIKINY